MTLGENVPKELNSLLETKYKEINSKDVKEFKEASEKIWWKIGKEVSARKELIFTAAKDLENIGLNKPLELAATDIFVEKAQKLLTGRAKVYSILGVITTVLAFLVLSLFAYYAISHATIGKMIAEIKDIKNLNGYLTWIIIIKSTTIAAIFFTMAAYLLSLSKAFFHESTVLYNRRHALRFGRLFVYLKGGDVQSVEELESAFNWNGNFSTAFKDVQTEHKTFLSKASEQPAEMLRSSGEFIKNIKGSEATIKEVAK